jgi:hypothetical protein
MPGVLILQHSGTLHVCFTLGLGRSQFTLRPNRTFTDSPLDEWNLVIFAKALSNFQVDMKDTSACESGVSVPGIEVFVLFDPLGQNDRVLEIIPAREVSFLGDEEATERGVGKDADPVGTGGVSNKVLPIRR